MPDPKTLARARRDKQAGKSPGTQAGEFVREEMEHVREGKHGARSTKQAIAIGLSKARRAGVKLPAPRKGSQSPATRHKAEQDLAAGRKPAHAVSRKRSRAVSGALAREGHQAASPGALATHARSAARKRSRAERSAAAMRGLRTKGSAVRKAAARKAARTRARRRTGGV
jgi:uncharacterized protein DUF6496